MNIHLNHLNEEQLVELFYGESADPHAAETHLNACDDCRATFDELRQVLASVEAQPVPERAKGYGREVWARIQPRLEEQKLDGWLAWLRLRPQPMALAATVALVLVFGVLLGRFTAPNGNGLDEAQVRERILLLAVGEHLDRSQMVLVELVNISADATGPVDISAEQEWAEDLVADNRLYRLTAADTGDAALVDLLDELERILLEVAHSPAEMDSAEFTQIREQIEEQGILFKIRIVSSQVREREESGWQEPEPNNSQS